MAERTEAYIVPKCIDLKYLLKILLSTKKFQTLLLVAQLLPFPWPRCSMFAISIINLVRGYYIFASKLLMIRTIYVKKACLALFG